MLSLYFFFCNGTIDASIEIFIFGCFILGIASVLRNSFFTMILIPQPVAKMAAAYWNVRSMAATKVPVIAIGIIQRSSLKVNIHFGI
jgi:hypothetical protein